MGRRSLTYDLMRCDNELLPREVNLDMLATCDTLKATCIEFKNYMDAIPSLDELWAERARLREEIGQATVNKEQWVELIHENLQFIFVTPLAQCFGIVSFPISIREERIARLQQRLQAIIAIIRLALHRARSLAALCQVFLFELPWFLYHGDHPPRYTPAVSGVFSRVGRTCSVPAAA